MKKTFISFLAICSFSLITSLAASEVKESYDKYKDTILSDMFRVQGEYLFVAGKAKIRSSSSSSYTMAQRMALIALERNIAKIKLESPGLKKSYIKSALLKKTIFDSWTSMVNLKYTAKNRIDLDNFSKNGYFYHVAAYKVSNIEFKDNRPITWERIYNDFKNNPRKRNELLFYEIIPENEIPALKDVVENNIARQYGKNFALMFMGKEVPAITKQRYDNAKKYSEKYHSGTSLKSLIIAADTLPYDKKICNLLAEKFDKMQMSRCADIMRKRAKEGNKLNILPEPGKAQAEKMIHSAETENKKVNQKTFFESIGDFFSFSSDAEKKIEKTVIEKKSVSPEKPSVKEVNKKQETKEIKKEKKKTTTLPENNSKEVDFLNML